jgi:tartrate dehydrogenase/decarboxylase / D-malate dehydrogenase
VLKYAFELAMTRPRRKVTSATKSNGITFTMPYWDERFAEMAKHYPEVTTDQFHIDILCAHFVQHPDWFDVVVGSNLFGDILSDLGPAVAGSIGIAPSANINPEKALPSMFEPVHGSAPDIAGKWICNPIGQIWSGAMMLEHLGEKAGGRRHREGDRGAAGRGRAAHPRHGRPCRHGGCRQGHRRGGRAIRAAFAASAG